MPVKLVRYGTCSYESAKRVIRAGRDVTQYLGILATSSFTSRPTCMLHTSSVTKYGIVSNVFTYKNVHKDCCPISFTVFYATKVSLAV